MAKPVFTKHLQAACHERTMLGAAVSVQWTFACIFYKQATSNGDAMWRLKWLQPGPSVSTASRDHRLFMFAVVPAQTVSCEFASDGEIEEMEGEEATEVERLWMNFFSEPLDWWDNRSSKRTVGFPDFRNKVTKEGLWVDSEQNPSWVKSKLDSIEHRLNAVASTIVKRPSPKDVKREEQKVLWEEFFLDPSQWKDNRLYKKNPQQPDFRHKRTNAALWINNLLKPPWVETQLATLQWVGAHSYGESGCGLSTSGSAMGYQREADVSDGTQKLKSLCEEGKLKEALDVLQLMEEQGLVIYTEIYRYLLQGCIETRSLAEAKEVHARIQRNGFESNSYLGESLVNMFVKCGSLPHALNIFNRLPQRTAFSWTAIISGYTKEGQHVEAVEVYKRMRKEGIIPNKYTFVSVLKSCGILQDLEEGKSVHAEVVACGCESNLYVGTTLVDMYSRCGIMDRARQVFDTLCLRDIVLWNGMIAGYVQQGQYKEALQLYKQMHEEGVSPHDRVFVSVLKACGSLATTEEGTQVNSQLLKMDALLMGKTIHTQILRHGCELDDYVATTLISMYAVCGRMEDAQSVFEVQTQCTVESWNALIEGYVEQEQGARALELYDRMKEAGFQPDTWTFVSILKACVSMATMEQESVINWQAVKLESLHRGKAVHAELVQMGHELNTFVGNTLIHMYARFGSLVDARSVFDSLSQRSVVSWNAMIAGYADLGQGEEAIQLYGQMRKKGVVPNESTFLCILKASSGVGALNMCIEVHRDLVQIGLPLRSLLASSLILAYGKCGSMKHAQQLFDTLAEPDVLSWNSLIAGYARQAEVETSLQCFEEMLHAGTKPDEVTFNHVLTSCSHAGMVHEGLQYFKSMGDHSIAPGLQHYANLVDLLGRAGLFKEVEDVIAGMPMEPDLAMWLSILSSCRNYSHVDCGRRAFESAVKLDSVEAAPYVLMSTLYRQANMPEDADKVEKLRTSAGAWKKPGKSWIEQGDEVHEFLVGDRSHVQSKHIFATLSVLSAQMKIH